MQLTIRKIVIIGLSVVALTVAFSGVAYAEQGLTPGKCAQRAAFYVTGQCGGLVDSNNDGICDYRGTGQGRGYGDTNGDGICDNLRDGQATGCGNGSGNGNGRAR